MDIRSSCPEDLPIAQYLAKSEAKLSFLISSIDALNFSHYVSVLFLPS